MSHRLVDEFPELDGLFPDVDFDEVLLGPWDERKSPQSLANRRFLAEVVRIFRREAKGLADRRYIRDRHREWRTELIAVEAQIAGCRRSLLSDWQLWKAKPEGGIQ